MRGRRRCSECRGRPGGADLTAASVDGDKAAMDGPMDRELEGGRNGERDDTNAR